MDNGVIKTIYLKLNTAFLKNEREKAERMLSLLEYETGNCDIMLYDGLGEIHFDRCCAIRSRMQRGDFGRLYGNGESAPAAEMPISKELEMKESEFHRILMDKPGKPHLFEKLGVLTKANIAHELDMEPYGRVDMLIRDARTWHVVEVKIGDAPSSVVSQIDKYRLKAELDFNYCLHDQVKATVIAQSFPPYVASELSRLSVRMVTHAGTAESLRIIQ